MSKKGAGKFKGAMVALVGLATIGAMVAVTAGIGAGAKHLPAALGLPVQTSAFGDGMLYDLALGVVCLASGLALLVMGLCGAGLVRLAVMDLGGTVLELLSEVTSRKHRAKQMEHVVYTGWVGVNGKRIEVSFEAKRGATSQELDAAYVEALSRTVEAGYLAVST